MIRIFFIAVLVLASLASWGQQGMLLAVPSAEITGDSLVELYPDAVGAYSLRRLSTSYAGDCITIKRTSDYDTLNIGFFNGYVDTASIKSFASTNAAYVTRIYDQSGNEYNLEPQDTATINYAFIYNGTNIVYSNGFAALRGGTQSYLASEVNSNIDIGNATSIIVGENTNVGSTIRFIQVGTNIPRWQPAADNSFRFDDGSISGSLAAANQSFLRFSVKTSSNDYYDYINNLTNIDAVNDAGSIEDDLYLNTINLFFFQELIFYLDDKRSDRTGIQNNINNYYSIY